LSARTFSISFMTFAGLKKCVPTTLPGREVTAAIAFTSREDVLVARIHVLHHRLDDDIGVRHGVDRLHRLDAREPACGFIIADAAFAHGGIVNASYSLEAFRQGFSGRVLYHGRDSGVCETHGDPGAHGAAADDGRPLNFLDRGLPGNTGDLHGLALGEKNMPLGLRLLRFTAFEEQLAFPRDGVVKRHAKRVAHALDTVPRSNQAAGAAKVLFSHRRQHSVGVRAGVFRHGAGGGPLGRLGTARAFFGKHHRCLDQIVFRNAVQQPDLQRARCRHRLAAQNHLQRRPEPHQSRQTLGAAGAGHEAELGLRKAEARVRAGDPIVAAERQLAAAAQGNTVDRRDDRFAGDLDGFDKRRNRRFPVAIGFVELVDIRAAAKAAPASGQHHRRHIVPRAERRHLLVQHLSQRRGQRVDRRIVEKQHGNAVLDHGVHHR
jgi:hypothetical protein